ncbi:MAG: hypothetical protein N3D14_04010 [Aquificaceae bacterium]|nr:hypothetical protein [Aquificaceae bacterium]
MKEDTRESKGPSLVSVLVYVGQQQQATHNYRACDERTEYAGSMAVQRYSMKIQLLLAEH